MAEGGWSRVYRSPHSYLTRVLLRVLLCLFLSTGSAISAQGRAEAAVTFLGPASVTIERSNTNLAEPFSLLIVNGSASDRISVTLHFLAVKNVDGDPVPPTALHAVADRDVLPASDKTR